MRCVHYHRCGQVSDKKQLKGERITFDSQSERISPIKAGKAWHCEGKAIGYIVSTGRKQRTDRKWGLTSEHQGPTLMAHNHLSVPPAVCLNTNDGRHFIFSKDGSALCEESTRLGKARLSVQLWGFAWFMTCCGKACLLLP